MLEVFAYLAQPNALTKDTSENADTADVGGDDDGGGSGDDDGGDGGGDRGDGETEKQTMEADVRDQAPADRLQGRQHAPRRGAREEGGSYVRRALFPPAWVLI